MEQNKRNSLGKVLRQQRLMIPLTLQELAAKSSVSASHLGRIERGERSPSASILQKIAKPLGFEESELLSEAGFLSSRPAVAGSEEGHNVGHLDPYVAMILLQEPVEMQRAVVTILSVLKSIAKTVK